MLDFKTYRETAPVATTPDDSIDAAVDSIVNKWVGELIASLTTGAAPGGGHPTDGTSLSPPYGPAQKRGLWDRFKGTLSNLWWGRDNSKNPYRWVNKFGDDLGVESFLNIVSLQDYNLLKETCDELEQQLNEVSGVENLRLVKIIRASAEHLKSYLKQALTNASAKTPELTMAQKMGQHSAQTNDAKPATAAPVTPTQANDPATPTQADDAQNNPATPAGDVNQPKDQDQTQNQQAPTHNEYNTPPTMGKKWADLSTEEIDAWNNYGGKKIGGMRPITSRCLRYLKGNSPGQNATPITQIPWVLRIGDPRLEILQSLAKDATARFADTHLGEVPPEIIKKTPKFCKSDSGLFKKLLNAGGIETPIKKIENEDDLKERIEAAKIAIKNAELKPGNTAPPEALETPATQPEAPVATQPEAPVPPQPAANPAPDEDDSFLATAAPIEPKQKTSRAKRIKPDFDPNSSAIQPKIGKRGGRRGKTRLENPIHPTQNDEDQPEIEDERNTAEFQEKIKSVEDMLDNAIISNPEFAELWSHLQQKLEKFTDEPTTMAALDKYIAELEGHIRSVGGDIEDFSNEWNLSNYVDFYKNKLRNQHISSHA